MSKQKYLVMDIASCMDCNDCFMACKDEHVYNDWMPYTAGQERHGPRWCNMLRTERGQYPRIDVAYLALMCQHCENCPLVEAGYATRREDGIVLMDHEKAKGVKEVMDMCPYGVLWWNNEVDEAQKCTMCAHILDMNQPPYMPRCAHSCPTESMRYYDVEPEEMEQIIEEQGLRVYKPEYGMNPHVYYKNLYRFTEHFISGEVVDKETDDCVEDATVTLKGEGKEETQKTDYFGEFKFDQLLPGTYEIGVNGKPMQTVELEISLNIGELFIDI